MSGRFRSSFLLFALACALYSCSGHEEVIPRSDMAKIYAEIFLLDNWINTSPDLIHMADSTLVYEAVLNKYGYDTGDYLETMESYIKDPQRWERVLRRAKDILRNEQVQLLRAKRKRDGDAAMDAYLRSFGIHPYVVMDTLIPLDSLYRLFFEEGYGNIVRGPFVYAPDSIHVLDSLGIIPDWDVEVR